MRTATAKRIVATYVYTDEAEQPLYEVVRYEPKDFTQRVPDAGAEGGYRWKLDGIKRVPYCLPKLRARIQKGHTILVPEGEKDVDSIMKLGLCATTNAQGAGWAWPADFVDYFRGAKRIAVIADCDDKGRGAARSRALLLTAVCDDVRLVDLAPDRKDGYDVSDWIDEGHTREELIEHVVAAPTLAAAATPHIEPCQPGINEERERRGPAFIRASDLASQPEEDIQWVVAGMIPSRGTALIVSKPKVGKSTLALMLGLMVARGHDFLRRETRKGAVLYAALEGAEQQLCKRLAAMGVTDEDDLFVCVGRAPDDAMSWLREAANRHKPILIIIDTLQRFARLKDLNDYAAVSNATDPLIELARISGAALLYAHHAGKSERADIGDSVLGSTAIHGSVDMTLFLKRSERYRTIATEGRFGNDLEETVLTMDPATFMVALGGTKHAADVASMGTRIRTYLASQTEGVIEKAIHESIDGRRQTRVETLRLLVERGEVQRSGSGKKGDPYRYADIAEKLVPVVPEGSGELENQNPETFEKTRQSEVFSGSQVSTVAAADATPREPALPAVAHGEIVPEGAL